MRWEPRRIQRNVGARRKVGAGGVLLGAGLFLGALLYFLAGGDPLDFFRDNLTGLDSAAVTESIDNDETF